MIQINIYMAVKSIRFTVANGNFGKLCNFHKSKMTAVNSIATSNQHKLMILGVYPSLPLPIVSWQPYCNYATDCSRAQNPVTMIGPQPSGFFCVLHYIYIHQLINM